MLQPNRNGGEKYRYNFQGQETDDEVKGKGNSVNYKYRMHDARLGRFFAVDPLTASYPHYTPYSFSGNKVVRHIELEGLEEIDAFLKFGGGLTGDNNDRIPLAPNVVFSQPITINLPKAAQEELDRSVRIAETKARMERIRKAQVRAEMAEARAEFHRMQNPIYLMVKMSPFQGAMDVGLDTYDGNYMSAGIGLAFLAFDVKMPFKFQGKGYSYTSKIDINSETGIKTIDHYLSKGGEVNWIGQSTISKEGDLFNMFEVPSHLRGMGASKAMYKNLDNVGYSTVSSFYGKTSDNFSEFMKVYNETGDKVKAAYATPAAKAKGFGWTPQNIEVLDGGAGVTMKWKQQ